MSGKVRAPVEIFWPGKKSPKIWPIFLPFLGCPRRCVFCAQETQTGRKKPAEEAQLTALLADCRKGLLERKLAGGMPPQLAFYGGTFTAVSESVWHLCLDFTRGLLREELVCGMRCSTRPDSLTPSRLQDLHASGCNLVELGVQSFNDAALSYSGRGCSRAACIAACAMLADAGFDFGIQLMPGMPGSKPEDFGADVDTALALGASCLRFYPCLVLAGSPLAAIWKRGEFRPWSMRMTLSALADGWLKAMARNVPVIRMGVAPQAGLEAAILAGPWHSALGSRVLGMALLKTVGRHAAGGAFNLSLPFQLQGCFWGWHGELKQKWFALGLRHRRFWDKDIIRIEWPDA